MAKRRSRSPQKGRKVPKPSGPISGMTKFQAWSRLQKGFEIITGRSAETRSKMETKIRTETAKRILETYIDVDPVKAERLAERTTILGISQRVMVSKKGRAFYRDTIGRWRSAKTGKMVRKAYVDGYEKRMRKMSGARLLAKALGTTYREAKELLGMLQTEFQVALQLEEDEYPEEMVG